MLHAHLMIRSYNRPLKKAPNAFDAVCVDVSMYPFLFRVVNRAMRRILILDAAIAGMLVCVDICRLRNRRLMDKLMELLLVHPFQGFNTDGPFALKRTDNGDF